MNLTDLGGRPLSGDGPLVDLALPCPAPPRPAPLEGCAGALLTASTNTASHIEVFSTRNISRTRAAPALH
jgi:hypothetical protein